MLVAAEHVNEVGYHRQRRQTLIRRGAVDIAGGRIDEIELVVARRLEVAPDGVNGASPVG
jgi:hypothetical protein